MDTLEAQRRTSQRSGSQYTTPGSGYVITTPHDRFKRMEEGLGQLHRRVVTLERDKETRDRRWKMAFYCGAILWRDKVSIIGCLVLIWVLAAGLATPEMVNAVTSRILGFEMVKYSESGSQR